MQQSPALGAPAIQSWQLLLPHTSPAWQWESESQSPWPALQGALLLQKLQSQLTRCRICEAWPHEVLFLH